MDQNIVLDASPFWWMQPNESDLLILLALLVLVFLLFTVIYLYAYFDRYTERRGALTPLSTTIPTMLTVGLAYDLLPPLESVNVLIPLSLLLAAFARDIFLWTRKRERHSD